jgi:hypothetical protein
MIVTSKQILLQSVRSVFQNTHFMLLLWMMNALAALILTVPVYNVLIDNLGRSMMSEKLALGFDYMWYLQFRQLYHVQFDQTPMNIYFIVGIYLIVQTFFSGGLISIFHIREKNHMMDFFYGGVRYFLRFFKILLVSLLFFAIAFKINDYLGDLITWMFKNSENVTADFILKSLRYLLLVFLIGVVTMIADYSRVSLAVKDKTNVLRGIYEAILFIKNNFQKTFLLFLIVAVIGAVGAIVYNVMGKFIPRTPSYFLIVSFILQQMLIIFRLLVRMLFFSTEVNLFKDLSADIVKVEINN